MNLLRVHHVLRSFYLLAALTIVLVIPFSVSAATANIVATSIVCDTEADLPNWGSGSGPAISATTATDFLATHPNCHPASGWVFEWGPIEAYYSWPADSVGVAGGPWVATSPTNASGVTTVQVPTPFVWVRLEAKSGYVPFTGINGSNGYPYADDISAEIHCNLDHIFYDNMASIGTDADQTYYCVAFNAPYTHTLSVSISGSGPISSGSGINCPGTCSKAYAHGSTVILIATPTSGYTFDSWSGACAGQGSTCSVYMDADKTAQANFRAASAVACPTLSVDNNDINTGSSVTLTWACVNASSCSALSNSDGFSTGGALSGSDSATPTISSGAVTYGVTCDGSQFYFPGVTVHSPQVSISAVPARVPSGGSTTVAWSSTGATSCSVTKNGSGWRTGTSNTGIVEGGIAQQTVYKVTCQTGSGEVSSTVVVNTGGIYQQF